MKDFELVIIGGGLASARAIKSYREAGGGDRIALVSSDTVVPYHRPPLSKKYLRGETDREGTLVEPEAFYDEQDVELLIARTAERVLPGERRVELDGADGVRYEKLLLATGAWPRMLDVPGADLDGVFTLRTLETPELSQQLADLYRQKGVEVVLGDSVSAFRGNGRLEAVETGGGRTISADLAVVGIGVVPQTAFLEGSGIAVDNGIVVDESFRTSVPNVWAVGDAASFHDPVFGRRRRIEHWSNSNYQGTEVGKALAGQDVRYDIVSTFFTEVFGVTVKVFGDTAHAHEREFNGSLVEAFVCLCLEDGRIAGAILAGQDEETEEELKRLIRERAPEEAWTRPPSATSRS